MPLTNAQTLTVWAKQTQHDARSAHGSVIVQGRALFSYGPHFAMAFIIPQILWRNPAMAVALVTADRYSTTTSKQLSQACGAFVTTHKAARLVSIPDLTPLAHTLAGICAENLGPENLAKRIPAAISAHLERCESERSAEPSVIRITRDVLGQALMMKGNT